MSMESVVTTAVTAVVLTFLAATFGLMRYTAQEWAKVVWTWIGLAALVLVVGGLLYLVFQAYPAVSVGVLVAIVATLAIRRLARRWDPDVPEGSYHSVSTWRPDPDCGPAESNTYGGLCPLPD